VIARLRGELLERGLQEVVVDAGGVGYGVHVTLNTLAALGPQGSEVDLHIHTQVREDAITLFGFATRAEREAFRRLIAVSGVGPKLARSVLSTYTPAELAGALHTGDLKRLSRVPGVGKRTAERLVVELRDAFADQSSTGSPLGAGALSLAGRKDDHARALADLESALGHLGYRGAQLKRALAAAEPQAKNLSLEELLRLSLSSLQGRR